MDRSLPRKSSRKLPTSTEVPVDGSGGEKEGAGETQYVEAVARAISILTAFHADDGPLGNSELAERTDLSKSTVSRLAYTLTRCGFLSFNPRYRVYELGPSVHALGHIAARSSGVRQIARPLMQQFASQANFNVGLGTRDGTSMVCLEAFEGSALIGLRLSGGSRLPILQSAIGRAYLNGLEDFEREAILAELRADHQGSWAEIVRKLETSREELKRHGFCTSIGDWRQDINGVAAPVRSPADGRVYAINLGGPAYLLPAERIFDELGPKIVRLAQEIEKSVPVLTLPIPSGSRS